jgi:hypothetical protein
MGIVRRADVPRISAGGAASRTSTPASYDPKARIGEMDLDGVDAR